MGNIKITAIVLAGGRGSRMKGNKPKQYMELKGRPILTYSLEVFQRSEIDDIILVVGKGEIEYCKEYIVEQYGYTKVTNIVEGGKERYESVYYGLQCITDSGYVLIHDAARPFVTSSIVSEIISEVLQAKACVIAVPVKDTIKISNQNKAIVSTPNRENLWIIQTPQAFCTSILKEAYEKLMKENEIIVTDDSMVIEQYGHIPVKIVQGNYRNIKITTEEDLIVGEAFLAAKQ